MADVTLAVGRSRVLTATAMAAAAVAFGLTGVLAGLAFDAVRGNRMEPWILGRAAGVCAYVLLVAVVVMGLLLARPTRARSGGSSAGRIRTHMTLALFTFAFTALHVVVLATDRWAGVGWWGAIAPLGATYRPVPVTLGLFGLWTGLLVGGTAALAGRLPRRVWWPLHKLAAASLVLIWLHGVLAGGDTPALMAAYVGSGALVLAVALWRYNAPRADRPGR